MHREHVYTLLPRLLHYDTAPVLSPYIRPETTTRDGEVTVPGPHNEVALFHGDALDVTEQGTHVG